MSRAVSDGRSYTYAWSQRGQLLAETIQGVDVRTFTYDGAGRLVEATVFTLTTKLTYNGLGARVAVEVVGYGTTTVTLDYAGGNAILAETTITGTVRYLYGRDCLGELRDDEWLYYQHDGDRMVRQGTDAEGEVASTWLFDPDGTMLEGPDGPVSHLICGGVYDWSTGLIYKSGRYFDPTLGIWLALVPLVVVQSWRRRKKKGWRGLWAIALVLFLVGMSGMLTGCCENGEYCPESVCADVWPGFDPITDKEDKCRVRDVRTVEYDVVKPPEADEFSKEIEITFLLEPGVNAETDCFCGSWVKGELFWVDERGSKRNYKSSPWEEPFYDFPLPNEGIWYEGSQVRFWDKPWLEALDVLGATGALANLKFWTVLYNRNEVEQYIVPPIGNDDSAQRELFQGYRDSLPHPVCTVEWCFDDSYVAQTQ